MSEEKEFYCIHPEIYYSLKNKEAIFRGVNVLVTKWAPKDDIVKIVREPDPPWLWREKIEEVEE